LAHGPARKPRLGCEGKAHGARAAAALHGPTQPLAGRRPSGGRHREGTEGAGLAGRSLAGVASDGDEGCVEHEVAPPRRALRASSLVLRKLVWPGLGPAADLLSFASPKDK